MQLPSFARSEVKKRRDEQMPVVVDANLLVALISGDRRGNVVMELFLELLDAGVEVHAPELSRYEVTNAITRLIVGKAFQVDQVEEALRALSLLPITYHHLEQATRVVDIALKLGRQNAYDAAYLALAEDLSADLLTMDGPLYRNASGQGFSVRLVV
jgi:predicted nucleic acid-binding protein